VAVVAVAVVERSRSASSLTLLYKEKPPAYAGGFFYYDRFSRNRDVGLCPKLVETCGTLVSFGAIKLQDYLQVGDLYGPPFGPPIQHLNKILNSIDLAFFEVGFSTLSTHPCGNAIEA
jgi:hypothetical protein